MDLGHALKGEKIILFDGGMGTQLEKHGLALSGGINNLTNPDIVRQVHEGYIRSGSEVIITNTFTMNPIYMKTHGLNIDVNKINNAGVSIAQEAAAGKAYVLGGMGPTGQMVEPYGTYTEDDFFRSYYEQADILARSGVDGLIAETMFDLKEALAALRACLKAAPTLPVIVSFALSQKTNGGSTMMGHAIADCARAVAEHGGSAVGINCGDLDPDEIAAIVAELYPKSSLPILVEPNAGKPKLVDGETVYHMSPEEFARGIEKSIHAGAKLVGGCCGTTPAHIKEVSGLIKG